MNKLRFGKKNSVAAQSPPRNCGRHKNWTLIPASPRDIAAVRERCRRLVRRRAIVSASVAAVPIPGLDVVSDLRLFALLIDDINEEFGLSERQIERLQPKFKLIAYEAAIGVGGMLVGKLVTREVVLQVLRRTGCRAGSRRGGEGGKKLARPAGARAPGPAGGVTRPAAPRSRPAPPGCPGGPARS
jgi:hypothetical protein